MEFLSDSLKLCKASELGDLYEVRRLYEKLQRRDASRLQEQLFGQQQGQGQRQGQSLHPAHLAAAGLHCDVVRFFVDCGLDVEAQDSDSLTLLHIALQAVQEQEEQGQGQEQGRALVRLLLELGADVEAMSMNYQPSLITAATEPSMPIEIVKMLVEVAGANVDYAGGEGKTAVQWGAFYNNLPLVQYLLEDCTANMNVETHNGSSLLHSACSEGNSSVARYFIEVHGMDVNARDNNGNTPLHAAIDVYNSDDYLPIYLIRDCNADFNQTNNLGQNALHFAANFKRFNLVAYLLEDCGADITATDASGDNVEYYAEQENVFLGIALDDCLINYVRQMMRLHLDNELLAVRQCNIELLKDVRERDMTIERLQSIVADLTDKLRTQNNL